eukprot:CAMPEP_0201506558 /NCGR_PEP_ID=MMETSP0161_2-20130828/474_1 /ASSEMBLY_ACC=CAM_ASM_000251 /TAXON_ID=180227 /ORGANISM="Neoparamoeba aestuarina, Strain SoJaBio B1-5/56/2" /LENGTH=986 /DNA_ID=CAMNT_0047900685 /DNA_START=179 /DNA_END=3139 /DNA_ORIENTATION=-
MNKGKKGRFTSLNTLFNRASGSSSSSSSGSKTDTPPKDSRDSSYEPNDGCGESSSSSANMPSYNYEPEFFIPSGPFSSPDTEEFIRFEDGMFDDGRPLIKAATLEKLVERATYEGYPDVKYVTQFLLTYRSFTTATALLDLLALRLNLPPPELSPEEVQRFHTTVQTPVRLRVLNLINSWATQYAHDFADDPKSTEDILNFLEKLAKIEGMTMKAKKLQMKFKKNKTEQEKTVTHRTNPPKPHIPKFHDGGATLLEINPVELARQLTLYESELFRKIKPWEFLNQSWAKKGGVNAPNVLEMIHWSTRVSGFVASEIMKAPINKKIRVISYFMQVAKNLREMNNFNALMEVIAGFENAAVWRLQPFFQEVPRRYAEVMDDLRVTMSTQKNNKSIREVLRSVDMPCIPYLGMFLTDLTFIEDGNPDTTKEGLINFTKRRYVAQVILEIQQYQQIPYCLQAVPIITSFLRTSFIWDDEKLYQMSMQFMPRSAKDKSVKELEVLYLETEKELKAARKKELEEDIDWGPLEDMPGYPFNEEDSPDNISVDERGALLGASLPKLIQRLTARPTPGFMETFLVTWPTFCSAEDFSNLLLIRFNPPNPTNEKKIEEYQKKVVLSVKTRVVNILKSFIEKFSFHFSDDTLVNIFRPLLGEILQSAGVLSKTVEKLETRLNSIAEDINNSGAAPIEHIIPASPPFQGIRDYEQKFAEELTMRHHRLFLKLRPQCLLSLQTKEDSITIDPAWSAAMAEFLKEYVKAERFCYEFVVSQVVAEKSPKARASVVEGFIIMCETCNKNMDYLTMLWILNGLSSKSLRKLPQTWAAVSFVRVDSFKQLQLLMKDLVNVHSFRENTYEPGDRFVKPCIPPITSYINNFLQRVGVPDELDNGLINFTKREGMASLIMDIMKLQKLSYNFERVPDIQQCINFYEEKLKKKAETLSLCAIAGKEEGKAGQSTDDMYTQYLPPDFAALFVDFATNFLQDFNLFENVY